MLKRLSDAERDGDKIFAVIRGTAMNNNGYNVNLPATSVNGQKQALTDAYARSGILPGEVHYVEAHGTGTKLGDPTETRALGEFFSQGRNGHNLHVGSVKTNIGHLEAAAGIAGLIKVVLAMQHKQLPPSLNYKNPNPNIAFDELKLQVQHELGSCLLKTVRHLKRVSTPLVGEVPMHIQSSKNTDRLLRRPPPYKPMLPDIACRYPPDRVLH